MVPRAGDFTKVDQGGEGSYRYLLWVTCRFTAHI